MDQIDNLNLRCIRVGEGESTEKTLIGEITKVGTGQTVWKDRISIGQTLGVGPDMTIIIKVEDLEVMQVSIRFLRGRIVEENTEIIREMMIIAGIKVGVGPGTDPFPGALTIKEMIGVQVIVGLDQVQE